LSVIDEIKSRVTIYDICNLAGIEVKRSGSNDMILSIYHDERTPSLHIKHNGTKFIDYSWNEPDEGHGDVIQFYQDLYKIDYGTAINELCGFAGIDNKKNNSSSSPLPEGGSRGEGAPRRTLPPRPAVQQASTIQDCFSKDETYIYNKALTNGDAIDEALIKVKRYRLDKNREVFLEFFTYCLKPENVNKAAIDYLLNTRKITPTALELSDIFTINNYNQVNNHLKKEFPLDQLQRAGVFNKKCESCKTVQPSYVKVCSCGNEKFTGNLIFYNHRILIPYKHNGQIVYLRARYFDKDNSSSTDAFKYLGPKDDLLQVNTSRRFYNIDSLKKMFPGERLYIVEGEFDCIVLASELIGYNAIAIPGVSNLPALNKFNLLKPFDIHIIPDQDEPGAKLVDRLAEIFHGMDKRVTVHQLKGAKDVTEFVIKQLKKVA
jgi:hypothetical protein